MEEILASIRRIIADDSHLPRPEVHEPAQGAPAHETVADEPLTGAHVPNDSEAALGDLGPISELEHYEPVHEPTQAIPAAPSGELLESHGDVIAPQLASSEEHMAEQGDRPRHPLAPPEVAGLGSIELAPEEMPTLPPREPAASNDAVLHEPLSPHERPQDPIPRGYVPQAETGASQERLFAMATDSSVTAAFNTLAASRLVDNSEALKGLVREMIRPLVKAWVDENLPGMVERLVVAEIERMARG